MTLMDTAQLLGNFGEFFGVQAMQHQACGNSPVKCSYFWYINTHQ